MRSGDQGGGGGGGGGGAWGGEASRAKIKFKHFLGAKTASPGVFCFFYKLAFSHSETKIKKKKKKKMLKIYMFNLSYSENTGLGESVDDRALLCLAHLVSHLLFHLFFPVRPVSSIMATSSFDDSDDSGTAVSFCVCTELLDEGCNTQPYNLVCLWLSSFRFLFPMFPGMFILWWK